MQMYRYFIEFVGVTILIFAALLSDRNPTVMALVTFAVFTLGKDYNAHFSPLSATASYLIGRETSKDALYASIGNWLAVGCVAITFMPIKTFIDRV